MLTASTRRLFLLVTLLWSCVAAAPPASAHELGTTRVSIVFGNAGAYRVEVRTDAAALLEKLEAMADVDVTTTDDVPRLDLATRLRAREEIFWSRVRLAFDGRPAAAVPLEFVVAPPADATSPAVAVLRWSGVLPPGSTHFTWRYGWTFASYALSARNGVSPNPPGDETARVDEPAITWLEGNDESPAIAITPPAAGPRWPEIVGRYTWLGFTHILPLGGDHVLFVLGLYLSTRRLRPLLTQVSAFTVAHSVTLALSASGRLSVPAHLVEPLIAVSIAYVAIENIAWPGPRSTTRLVVVFGCGLLHGLGFAGALGELGMPRGHFLAALASFNGGVEAAQLTILTAASLLLGGRTAERPCYREFVVVPASLVIALVALYWTIERI